MIFGGKFLCNALLKIYAKTLLGETLQILPNFPAKSLGVDMKNFLDTF